MPNYAHHTFEGGGIAIWHITESPDTLYALLATTKYDAQLAGKNNDARRAEWLAVRLLVKELFGPDAEVAYHPTGRPYLNNSGGGGSGNSHGNSSVILTTIRRKNLAESHGEILRYAQDDRITDNHKIHISISHTKGYAAVAYSTAGPIGLDIEHISDRVERIAHRFTSAGEAAYIDPCEAHERQMHHLINWSAKETLYKLLDDTRMADFKAAFHIAPYRLGTSGELMAKVHDDKGEHCMGVAYRIFPDFVCTWA